MIIGESTGETTKADDAFFSVVFDAIGSKYNYSGQPIRSFPAVAVGPPANAANYSSFQSKISDLRLQRLQDRIDALHTQAAQDTVSACQRYSGLLRSENNPQIEQVFKPERAKRRDYPLYLENADRDKSAAQWRPKQQHTHLPMQEIEREFAIRLKQSKNRGNSRARQRMASRQSSSSRSSAAPALNQ
jgi:hypothetical protein